MEENKLIFMKFSKIHHLLINFWLLFLIVGLFSGIDIPDKGKKPACDKVMANPHTFIFFFVDNNCHHCVIICVNNLLTNLSNEASRC
jgi:hypothetical protein